jgi:hypothetical protein
VVVEQAAVQAQEQLQTLRQEKAAAESSLADALTFKNRAAETQASLDALKKELDQVKAAFEVSLLLSLNICSGSHPLICSLQARESEIAKLLTENVSHLFLDKYITLHC